MKIKVSNSVIRELFNLFKKKMENREFSEFAYKVFTCVLATINILRARAELQEHDSIL